MAKTLSTTTVIESEHEVKLVPRTTGIVTEVKATADKASPAMPIRDRIPSFISPPLLRPFGSNHRSLPAPANNPAPSATTVNTR
jgi:hypothetical protein